MQETGDGRVCGSMRGEIKLVGMRERGGGGIENERSGASLRGSVEERRRVRVREWYGYLRRRNGGRRRECCTEAAFGDAPVE